MTNWRALCEELHLALERRAETLEEDRLLDRSAAALRAALAQPEPEVVGPSVEELDDLFNEIDQSGEPLSWRAYARAVLSRWGRPAPAPAEGEVAELVASLRDAAASNERIGATQAAVQLTRVADLLERLASPACLVLDPSPETIAALKAAGGGRIELLPEDAQIIEPTERTILVPVPVPVAVSERLPGPGDCDAEGRCWVGYPEWTYGIADTGDTDATTPEWRLERPPLKPKGSRCWWLPAHALPLPSEEPQP